MSTANPTPTPPVVPGDILAGKYRVERIIGQGGMGLVVQARHIALEERVALKFLLPEYAMHPEASQRFLREARAAVKIKSEHVARVSDVGQLETGAPYMVMEFLDGDDLARTLQRSGVLPVADAIDFILQGCEAIAEAHAHGIVHRDLKPANLFLSKRPDGSPIVKVLDFGISKIVGGAVDNLTRTTAAMGSALYMSPEQMQQTRAVDHRTDIYALGIALYELLAGKQPYYAETLPQLCAEILTGTPTPLRDARPDAPPGLGEVVEKAYARDRAQRFQSIADFVVALAPFAPTCSQTTIDRIARMGGLPLPTAGGGPDRGSNPGRGSSPELTPKAGTQVMPQVGEPPPPTPPEAPAAPMQPAPAAAAAPPPPPPLRPGSDPHQIIPGPYSAPMSSRAAASFAMGPSFEDAAANKHPGSGGRTAAIGAAIIAILAIGGVATAFALRSGPTPGPASADSAHESPAPPGSAPPKADTSGAADKAKPPDTAPPAASALPSTTPTSGPLGHKGGKAPAVPPSFKPSTTPSATPKGPDIYGSSH